MKMEEMLTKWISGELTEEERVTFENSEDFKIYKDILEGTDLLEVPNYDVETSFNKVQEKIVRQKKSNFSIPKWTYGIAAAAVLLIGFFFFTDSSTHYSSKYGSLVSFSLPDASEVILNSNSKASFNKNSWSKNRVVELTGEAFFKVKKGSKFTVQTDNGKVEVLGTQFTVNTSSSYFTVKCFEGKVRINDSKIIEKGQAIRVIKNNYESWELNNNYPSWLNNESSFVNAPLSEVVTALQNQYKVTFKNTDNYKNKRFTGVFPNTNLKIAIATVFESLEIKYKFANNNTTIILE